MKPYKDNNLNPVTVKLVGHPEMKSLHKQVIVIAQGESIKTHYFNPHTNRHEYRIDTTFLYGVDLETGEVIKFWYDIDECEYYYHPRI